MKVFEVNLVPDVKRELLHKQRMRNFVIAICIFVAIGCGAVLLILGSIVGGQGIALVNQDADMKSKSEKILQFQNVNQILTLQDQLNKISGINENKKVLSRVFGVLDVILPDGDDRVTMAELTVDLEGSTISFDGQADSASNIDYRALEAFKKTVELSYYDYGHYMDKKGEIIPTMCIDEVTEGGIVYGVYHRGQKGCDGKELDAESNKDDSSEDEKATPTIDTTKDVKIKRDMSYEELEKAKSKGDYYFDSQCTEFNEGSDGKWTTTNTCMLVTEPVNVSESSNGRNSAGDLVLRFSAVLTLDSNIFSFGNKHMRVIGPTRQNVTDSYVQIRDMFDGSEECDSTDPACIGGNNNG